MPKYSGVDYNIDSVAWHLARVVGLAFKAGRSIYIREVTVAHVLN